MTSYLLRKLSPQRGHTKFWSNNIAELVERSTISTSPRCSADDSTQSMYKKVKEKKTRKVKVPTRSWNKVSFLVTCSGNSLGK